MQNSVWKKLLKALVFSIAMGLLEAVVVVYLRYMFYPNGFNFPLSVIPESIIKAELLRELCTLIMLISVAWIAGKSRIQIFSYFLFSFAVWDIFYYVGLKVLLNWPASFLTWDILFLIPVPWLGPVLAPVISSFTMILLSVLFLFLDTKQSPSKIKTTEWFLIFLGAAIIFITYIWDYTNIILSNGLTKSLLSLSQNETFQKITQTYVPANYNWGMFSTGIIFVFFSMFLILRRNGKLTNNTRN